MPLLELPPYWLVQVQEAAAELRLQLLQHRAKHERLGRWAGIAEELHAGLSRQN
jgi:hypothetical protein